MVNEFTERHAEAEISYSFLEKDLDFVIERITPIPRHFNVCGHHATIGSFERRQSIHFFGRGTEGARKERVRVWREDGVFVGSLDLKDYIVGTKYEKKLKRVTGANKIVKILRSISPIVSALMKDRMNVNIWWNNGPETKAKAKIGLDILSPICLEDPSSKSVRVYHLEIEGDGSGSEMEFVNSDVFKGELSKVLTPLTHADTKWILAKAVNEKPYDVSRWKGSSLKDFFSKALISVGPGDRHLLV